MIRFRNPGIQYKTQIQVLKLLYKELQDQKSFTLQDMENVIAKNRLMTSYGYSGQTALNLSSAKAKKDVSRDSSYNNAKMYAETFRMLGWITPEKNTAYPLVFTYIGIHIATAKNENTIYKLYEQCVLGINNPTELSDKMTYKEHVRFFKCVLKTIIDLGGIIYKHELCLGPMSVNDEDKQAFARMIAYIKSIRGNFSKLQSEFTNLATSLNMKVGSVDNCTRLPIALLKNCNLVISVRNKTLYPGKTLDCLKITQYGINLYNLIKNFCDIRLDSFRSFTEKQQHSLVRLGIFSMLERSGYNVTLFSQGLNKDRKTCNSILNGKDILFSPYQTIRKDEIEKALSLFNVLNNKSNKNSAIQQNILNCHLPPSFEESTVSEITQFKLDVKKKLSENLYKSEEDNNFIKKIIEYNKRGHNTNEIVNILFSEYHNASQSTFYPLIGILFRILGYNCVVSRPGDNGQRWDAIIIDPSKSIPIEIKSPTEVRELSIKAVRQALENKIVLLSRKTFQTDLSVTSLAIGYIMPHDRTDIYNLIKYIKITYGFRIGLIELNTLLYLAVNIIINKIGFKKAKLFALEGVLYADTK